MFSLYGWYPYPLPINEYTVIYSLYIYIYIHCTHGNDIFECPTLNAPSLPVGPLLFVRLHLPGRKSWKQMFLQCGYLWLMLFCYSWSFFEGPFRWHPGSSFDWKSFQRTTIDPWVFLYLSFLVCGLSDHNLGYILNIWGKTYRFFRDDVKL